MCRVDFEANRDAHAQVKRNARNLKNLSDTFSQQSISIYLTCPICSRVCTARIGLFSRSREVHQLTSYCLDNAVVISHHRFRVHISITATHSSYATQRSKRKKTQRPFVSLHSGYCFSCVAYVAYIYAAVNENHAFDAITNNVYPSVRLCVRHTRQTEHATENA